MLHVPVRLALVLMVAGVLTVACPFSASAQVGPATFEAERELAARYAPVMMLVEQDEPCGPGEPYQPSDVDALFENPSDGCPLT